MMILLNQQHIFILATLLSIRNVESFSLTAKSNTPSSSGSVVTTPSYWDSKEATEKTPPNILSQIRKSNWRGGLEPATDIYEPTECKVIQGSIPSDLVGTFFRNGPGRIRIGESIYGHWFDGDGYVAKISLNNRIASFQGSYVQTEKYKSEINNDGTNGPTVRGAWTNAKNGELLANMFRIPANNANTSNRIVTTKDGKRLLLALSEGGPPHAMDPVTMKTLGLYDYDSPAEFGSFDSMASAHPCDCPDSGEFFTCGLRIGVPTAWPSLTVLKVYKFIPEAVADNNNNKDDDSERQSQQHRKVLEKVQTIDMPFIAFVHDMTISKNYVCFVIPPYAATGTDLISSGVSSPPLGKRFKYDSTMGARIILLKRSDLSIVVDTYTKESISLYHIVNAIENEETEEEVEIQFAAHNGPREHIERIFGDMYHEKFTDADRCRLCSITVNAKTGTVGKLNDITTYNNNNNNEEDDENNNNNDGIVVGASAFELPSIHPYYSGKRHRYVYTNAAYPSSTELTNCIERLDLQSKVTDRAHFGPNRFAGEPVIVPKRKSNNDNNSNNENEEETNSYVIALVYDSDEHATDCVILDASNISCNDANNNPIATIRLPVPVPFGFHGIWTDELFL